MSITLQQKEIFKKGSKTYFNSSRFFPSEVRADVFILYAFVRVADDFVDSVPQDAKGFYDFKNSYALALSGTSSNNPVIDDFIELMHRRNFKPEWVDGFLHSMELDITKKEYNSLDETLEYIYGSAEVIGLFMVRLLNLPEESFHAAQMLGRSMQYINFIRDVKEDYNLGRRYLPLNGTDLQSLSPEVCTENPQTFADFINAQTHLYQGWQKEAEKGYRYIPKKLLVPIRTASDMYNWTAAQIQKNPSIIWKKKVKPPKALILWTILINRIKRVPQ